MDELNATMAMDVLEDNTQEEPELFDIISIDDQEYVLFTSSALEENSYIYANRIVKDKNGEEILEEIEDEEEQKMLTSIVNHIIDNLE